MQRLWLHWCAGPPPVSYILFPCSGVCWHALPFSPQLDTIGTTTNHHEPPETIWKLHYPRTSWNLYDPRILLDVPCSLAIKHRKQIFQLGNRSHCAQWHPRSWTKKRFCAPSAPAQTWRHANSSSSFHMCFKPWGRWLMLCA